MSQPKTDFFYTDKNQPHPERAKAMLQQFPEIKKLFGAEPRTMLIIFQLVIIRNETKKKKCVGIGIKRIRI